MEEGVEGADDLEVLGAAGFGFGAAGDPVAPAAHDDDVEERAFVASVTFSAMRRVPGSVGARPSGLTTRYPFEGGGRPLALLGAHYSKVSVGERYTMDLVNGIPRSPYESMHGIVFLPRAIDKVRAEIAGTLGDYISRTFFSGMLLEFLGIEPQDFVDAVAARDSDEEVWAWVKARMRPRSATEIMAFNRRMMTITPQDDTTRERYWQFMADIGQSTAPTSPASSTAWTSTKAATSPLGGRQ